MGSRKPKLGRMAAASVSPASRRRRPLKRNRRLQKGAGAPPQRPTSRSRLGERGRGFVCIYIAADWSILTILPLLGCGFCSCPPLNPNPCPIPIACRIYFILFYFYKFWFGQGLQMFGQT